MKSAKIAANKGRKFVAPARGRGLKLKRYGVALLLDLSPPQGGVD